MEHTGKSRGSLSDIALLDHAGAHRGGVTWCYARIAAKTLYDSAAQMSPSRTPWQECRS